MGIPLIGTLAAPTDFSLPDARFDMPELLTPGRQPIGPVKINWSHPLAAGLKEFGVATQNRTLVGNLPCNWLSVETKNGIRVAHNDAGIIVPGKASGNLLGTLLAAGVGVTNTTTYKVSLGFGYYVGGTNREDVSLLSSGSVDSSRLYPPSIFHDDPGAGTYTIVTNQVGSTMNVGLNWDARSPASGTYRYGVNSGNLTAYGVFPWDSAVDRVLNVAATGSHFKAACCAYWNRRLSNAEERAFYSDPYQFLIPA